MTSDTTDNGVPRLNYAASESSADMLYALGFMIPDPVLWFRVANQSAVVVSPLELVRARKQARDGLEVIGSVELRRRLGLDHSRQAGIPELIYALSEKYGVKEWQVPYDFPTGLVTAVREKGISLSPVRCFWPERSCKTQYEIEAVEEGVKLAQQGLVKALHIMRQATVDSDGCLQWQGRALTSERLRGEINAEIARNGGTASHTIAAPGPQGADPHCVGAGPIYACQPVVIDIFPRVNETGYHGDLTRTVVKQSPPPAARNAFEVVNAARQAAIAAVRPGISARKVHAAAADVIAATGFVTDIDSNNPSGFIHGTGHGLGLEVHEPPRLSSRSDETLQEGNIITIEPGLYYPAWGGVRIEDVVVVTAAGCRNLTTAEVFLDLS